MKYKFIITCIIIGAGIFCIFWIKLKLNKTDNSKEKIDEYIKVDTLDANLIIVKMGYDAVTAIATNKGIVVFDAGISNSLTTKYRKIIENMFKRSDFKYLINTHSHPDHIGGNQVFSDAIIVGHENCLIEIAEDWKDKEKIKSRLLKIVNDYKKELDTLNSGSKEWEGVYCQKNRYQYAYEDLLKDHIVTFPSQTFRDSLKISLGNVSLDMVYFGIAHSESDIIIHIPEMKLLMVGDLFFPGGKPSIDGEDTKLNVKKCEKVLQWISLRWNDIDIVIGGHGQVMSKKDLKAFEDIIIKKLTKALSIE